MKKVLSIVLSWQMVFGGLFILVAPLPAHAGTFTVLSCSYADVNAAINNTTPGTPGSPQHLAVNGDVIIIPACPGGIGWASTLTINGVGITLQGAGAKSSTSWVSGSGTTTTGTDQTVINPAVGGSSTITVNTTSGNPELRITGIAFIENSGSGDTGSGIVHLNGNANNVRIDHCHFYTSHSSKEILIGGSVTGVADHNFMDILVNTIGFFYSFYNGVGWNGGSDPNGTGDPSFADGDNWGTSKFFFVEDNYFNGEGTGVGSNGNYVTDCVNGGRGVIRYSSGINTQGNASHGTTSTSRGCRAMEIYQNYYSYSPNHASTIGHPNSGTMMAWGNTSTGMGNIVGAQMERILSNEGRDSEELLPAPNGWGYCGTKFATGTATTTGGSTAVTGTGFSTTWPAPFNMIIPGANCTGSFGTLGDVCKVSSVTSSSSLTLAAAAGTSVSGVTFTVGSPWDGGDLATGYACLDSPGRGIGDLLNGANFPSRVNTVTSTQSWPHQTLSPIYAWANNWTPTGTSGQGIVFDGTGTLADNRDYFMQYGTGGETGSNCTTSPCNITRGINQTNRVPVNGTDLCPVNIDPMTGSPVSGVGWWDTANITLYTCGTTANTWNAYYTPYTYPNPLAAPSATVTVSCASPGPVFGSIPLTNSSGGSTCTVTNNSATNATSVTPSSSGGNAGDFVVSGSTCGTVTASGGTCTFTETFTPAALGSRSSSASVSYSGGDGLSPATQNISGTGISQIGQSVTSISFGNVIDGITSAQQQVTITNNGTTSVTGLTLSLTGTDASLYTIVVPTGGGTNCNTTSTLAASASCVAAVTFSPVAVGTFTATLNFTDSATGSPQTVSLSGNGIAAPTGTNGFATPPGWPW